MWETAVRVERERVVYASPEVVWALLGDVAAWSVMPARFAFGVPAERAGARRPACLVIAGKTVTCAIMDVCQEVPGQVISWQTRSTRPSAKQVFTLSAEPGKGGTAARIAFSDVVPRQAKIGYQNYWRGQIDAWLDRLRAVAEGRTAWPAAGMPADMQRACAAGPRLANAEHAAAEVVIHASADAVWEVLWAPESAHIADPDHIVHAGHVPGAPLRQAGELQYFIHRHPDDRFTCAVCVIREFTEKRWAVTQQVGPPHTQTHHAVTPVPGGTRLELACHWPANAAEATGQSAAHAAVGLQAVADRYKTMIEESAASV